MRLLGSNPHGSNVGRIILEFDQRQALQRWLADAQVTGSLFKPPVLLIESVRLSYEFVPGISSPSLPPSHRHRTSAWQKRREPLLPLKISRKADWQPHITGARWPPLVPRLVVLGNE